MDAKRYEELRDAYEAVQIDEDNYRRTQSDYHWRELGKSLARLKKLNEKGRNNGR